MKKYSHELILQQRIDERDELISENRRLADTVETEGVLRKDQTTEDAYNQFMLGEYKDILSLLEKETYSDSLSRIEQIESSLSHSGRSFFAVIEPKRREEELDFLHHLHDSIERNFSTEDTENEPGTFSEVEGELIRYARSFESTTDDRDRLAIKGNLLNYVKSFPSLDRAFTILETDNTPQSMQENIGTPETSPKLFFLGRIGELRFNQIQIVSSEDEQTVLQEGMLFGIYRLESEKEMKQLGRGEIIRTDPPEGRILSLSSAEDIPKINDLVYLLPPKEL